MKKGKTYQTKLLAYFAVLLAMVALLFSGSYFVGIRGAMEKQLTEANLSALQVLQNSTEKMLQDMDRSLSPIAVEPAIVSFVNWALREDRDITYLIDFLQQKKKMISTNLYVSSCYVYYYANDTVLDIKDGRVRNLNEMTFLEDARCSDESQKDGELIRQAVGLYSEETGSSSCYLYRIDTPQRANSVVLVKSVTAGYQAPQGLLIVTLDKSYFSDLLHTVNTKAGTSLYIADKDGNFISEKEKRVPDLFSPYTTENLQELLSSSSGGKFLQTDNGNFLLSHTTSELYGWKFISFGSADLIRSKLWETTLLLLILFVICIVLGLLGVLVLSKRLYRPIQSLQNALTEKQDTFSGLWSTDLQEINEGIRGLKRKNQNLETLLDQNLPYMRQEFFKRLLWGAELPGEKQPLEEKMKFYQTQIHEYGCFAVAIVGISGDNVLDGNYSEEQASIFSLLQSELIQQAAARFSEASVEVIVMDEVCTLIIGLPAQGGEATLTELLEELHQTCTQNCRHEISIGVGKTVSDFQMISESYQQARSAFGYRIIRGNGQIIYIDNIPKVEEWYYHYPFEEEKQVFQQLRQGDARSAAAAIHCYFDELRNGVSKETDVKYASIHLLDQSIQFCGSIAIDVHDVFPKNLNLYQELLSQDSIETIQAWFAAAFGQIVQYICEKKENQGSELMERVVAYIRKNYASPDISMDQIAEKFHFSVSYLGKGFKYETGQTVKGYITELRIQRAQELLVGSGGKIKDVGNLVGYPNTQSFINAFKKVTGETPGEYQKRSHLDA